MLLICRYLLRDLILRSCFGDSGCFLLGRGIFLVFPLDYETVKLVNKVTIGEPFVLGVVVGAGHLLVPVLVGILLVDHVELDALGPWDSHPHVVLVEGMVVGRLLLDVSGELAHDLTGGEVVHQFICDVEFKVTDAVQILMQLRRSPPF